MNILLLENDEKVISDICKELNFYGLDVFVFRKESDIYTDLSLVDSAKLFILSSTLYDNKNNLLRKYNPLTPILLMVDMCNYDCSDNILKTIYYTYDCNDILVKDFYITELTYRVFKLCFIWNQDIINIDKDLRVDFNKDLLITNYSQVKLGKKETKLLKLLLQNIGKTITKTDIINYVYNNDLVNDDCIRALVKVVRKKLNSDIIKTIKNVGYKIDLH